MSNRKIFYFGLVLLLIFTAGMQAQIGTSQGVLFSGNTPGLLDGSYDLTFKLYSAAVGGTFLGYTDAQTGIAVSAESFTAVLGAGSGGPVSAAIFGGNQSVYVAIERTTTPGVEIGDRVPIYSSGYSHFAPAAGDATSLGGLSAAAFARLAISNTFSAAQTVNGNVSASQYNIGANRVLSTPGNANLFVGDRTGQALTTGSGNMASGSQALMSNTTGNGNTASGTGALVVNTTGSGNTAMGSAALLTNVSGFGNTATGTSALNSNGLGNNNTAMGYFALGTNIDGSGNTAIGAGADVSLGSLTNATAIGAGAIVSANNALVLGNNANVGIGTSAPTAKLHLSSQGVTTVNFQSSTGPNLSHAHFGLNGDWYIRSANQAGKVILQDSGGNVGIGTASPGAKLHVVGTTRTQVLQITGGADLSEQFEVNGLHKWASRASLEQVKPGMIASIDPDKPGKLIVSSKAYDRRVAGIISGAGGVKPGMLMSQAGSVADGEHPVALTGRVYCWADAAYGPIEPGDRLTSSRTPGHAMKVTDHGKAQGAIIGKAMTGLKAGKGLVLVLVMPQ